MDSAIQPLNNQDQLCKTKMSQELRSMDDFLTNLLTIIIDSPDALALTFGEILVDLICEFEAR